MQLCHAPSTGENACDMDGSLMRHAHQDNQEITGIRRTRYFGVVHTSQQSEIQGEEMHADVAIESSEHQ